MGCMAEGATRSAQEPTAADRRLRELVSGYQASAAIGALARLGVADALASGARSLVDLARSVGAEERALARLLEATLDLGLFTRGEDGRYGLGELGDLLRSDVPGSLRRFATVSTEHWRWAAYGHLDHTLRTGDAGFVAAHGCGLWDYLACHPEAAASFEESMTQVGVARDRAVAAAIDLEGVDRLVDVGGGRGGLMCALMEAHPQLHGIVFDLPSVIRSTRDYLRKAGFAERCEAIAGDFREEVPAGGNAYVLSWILHDWDDATALHILRTCRAAMEKHSRLFVIEMVVPEPGRANAAAFARLVRQTDLEMLAVVGGRERTAAEYEKLFAGAGCAVCRIVALEGMPWSVVEGRAV